MFVCKAGQGVHCVHKAGENPVECKALAACRDKITLDEHMSARVGKPVEVKEIIK